MATEVHQTVRRRRMPERLRLEGMRYGKLTVLAYAGQHRLSNGDLKDVWECRCDCGATVTIRADKLRSGHTRSCGCLRSESEAAAKFSKAAREKWRKVQEQHRTAEAIWLPEVRLWCELLAATLRERSVPIELLRVRWTSPGVLPPGWAPEALPPRRTAGQLLEILDEKAPRVPEAKEVEFLAACLNLRGLQKGAFVKAAKAAREAVAKHRAWPDLRSSHRAAAVTLS